jgi:hypothetical protein
MPEDPIKKGAGACPLYRLGPQNRDPVEVGSGHPGKPILVVCQGMVQMMCQRGLNLQAVSNIMKRKDLDMGVPKQSIAWRGLLYRIPHTHRALTPIFGRRRQSWDGEMSWNCSQIKLRRFRASNGASLLGRGRTEPQSRAAAKGRTRRRKVQCLQGSPLLHGNRSRAHS